MRDSGRTTRWFAQTAVNDDGERLEPSDVGALERKLRVFAKLARHAGILVQVEYLDAEQPVRVQIRRSHLPSAAARLSAIGRGLGLTLALPQNDYGTPQVA